MDGAVRGRHWFLRPLDNSYVFRMLALGPRPVEPVMWCQGDRPIGTVGLAAVARTGPGHIIAGDAQAPKQAAPSEKEPLPGSKLLRVLDMIS